MKTRPLIQLLPRAALVLAVLAPVSQAASRRPVADPADPAEVQPLVAARFVPDRKDDFAWENDLIAFRAYGPALREGVENSGYDAWPKRVKYLIMDKWYQENLEGKSYHVDHGEGADFYTVGSSRGVGGVALVMMDGSLMISDAFVDWRIIEQGPLKAVFELDYIYEGTTITETKRFTVEAGKRLFHVDARFFDNGEPRRVNIAVGVTTHEGAATVQFDQDAGWMACWEDMPDDNGELGTGAVVPGARFEEVRSDEPDTSHVYGYVTTDDQGRVSYDAGFAWAKAGEITTFEAWTGYLAEAAAAGN